jgi:uncharacterized protein (DUF362 family)
LINSAKVAIIQDKSITEYPGKGPFSPSVAYPEYLFGSPAFGEIGSDQGRIYDSVRRLLFSLNMDRINFDTPSWNPFGEIIQPGESVMIKPNFVSDKHRLGGDPFALVAHASVIRAVIDYVLIALKGTGKVIIGDAPVQITDFNGVIKLTKIDQVLAFYREKKIEIELIDFRLIQSHYEHGQLLQEDRDGDPRGYSQVDLGEASWFASLDQNNPKYRITCYDPASMSAHHHHKVHEYLISNSVLSSDVLISIPKMKTHRKVGVTLSLKNSVGIVGNKDWLPHHRQGSIEEGGDEYSTKDFLKTIDSKLYDLENSIKNGFVRQFLSQIHHIEHLFQKRLSRDLITEGSWYGNDTAWRMALDLNRILLYTNKDGVLKNEPQRRLFALVDGIVAGEGEGPLEPSPRPQGVLVGGLSFPAVDAVVAALMGFDYRKIPLIVNAFAPTPFQLTEITPSEICAVSDVTQWDHLNLLGTSKSLNFSAASGWRGFIEL